MIVCLCHRVSDRDIHRAVRTGTRCFDVLQDEIRVASSCGSCGDCAREVFEAACAQASSQRHDTAVKPIVFTVAAAAG